MTFYEIPTSSSNYHYTQTVQLSGVTYQLQIRYNTRMDRWILSVNDISGTPIVQGLPMLSLRSLTGQYTTLSLPPGPLFCLNQSSPYTEPSLTSFLTDTGFYYGDPDA
jgi:hypothetical protein